MGLSLMSSLGRRLSTRIDLKKSVRDLASRAPSNFLTDSHDARDSRKESEISHDAIFRPTHDRSKSSSNLDWARIRGGRIASILSGSAVIKLDAKVGAKTTWRTSGICSKEAQPPAKSRFVPSLPLAHLHERLFSDAAWLVCRLAMTDRLQASGVGRMRKGVRGEVGGVRDEDFVG